MDEFRHYGVKGMKWGVRRTPEQLGRAKLINGKIYVGRFLFNDMTKEAVTADSITKYKQEYKQLSHVKVSSNTKGIMFSSKGKLQAMVNTELKPDGTNWIQGLEIFGNSKGKNLSYALLDVAVKDLNATHLSVNKQNKTAKHVYDEYGFHTYKEDNNMYYMRIKK